MSDPLLSGVDGLPLDSAPGFSLTPRVLDGDAGIEVFPRCSCFEDHRPVAARPASASRVPPSRRSIRADRDSSATRQCRNPACLAIGRASPQRPRTVLEAPASMARGPGTSPCSIPPYHSFRPTRVPRVQPPLLEGLACRSPGQRDLQPGHPLVGGSDPVGRRSRARKRP